MKRRLAAAATVLAAAAAAIALLLYLTGGWYLTAADADTGRVYGRWPADTGDRFSVEFVHSVNKSPVRDVYEIRSGHTIWVVETDYSAFGAGVETELLPGEKLSYRDGVMVVTGIDTRIDHLAYFVGTVSDHTLRVGGEEISLRSLCGRNANVVFSCRRYPF